MPRLPRRSALSVLLFYCGTPRCCLVSSVPLDLRLSRYLTTYASLLAVHCCAYCRRYSPIGSCPLEPALIPLWTLLRSSNHTIYTVPLTVTSLQLVLCNPALYLPHPRREPPLERLLCPARASLCSSLSLVCDGTSNLVALVFRARAPFVIVLVHRHLGSIPRLGFPVSTG